MNIAGGPAIDCLNTLIVLRNEHPHLLEGRIIQIDVLDPDEAGPAFGKAALLPCHKTRPHSMACELDFVASRTIGARQPIWRRS